ncbi:MAG TPA: hypothetical protein PLB01_01870 [Thermoanaerobaculia bacterium]|nr:hypothetical protein [Thermoanaerobaculia bacterium]
MTSHDCLCDAFTRDWITSTADGVRPPTWRPLSEHPDARFGPDLEVRRRADLVLAWCTACGRRWYLSWDVKDDCYHPIPLGSEMLDVLNLDIPLPRLAAFLLGPAYGTYSWALEGFVDRFLWEGAYDAADAEARLREALATAGLKGAVRSSLERRLTSVLEREKRRAWAARPRRRRPENDSQR